MKFTAAVTPCFLLGLGTVAQAASGGKATALYFLDNNPAGSSIVASKVSPDGTLSQPVRVSTGGTGALAFNDGLVPQADSAQSQGSVFIFEDLLFTVNCGSSTVSMFRIPANDPLHPVLVGKPAPVHGLFPNSVTYSTKLGIACAVTTGTNAAVTCFDVDKVHGLVAKGSAIPLPMVHETNPPKGLPGTVSEIVFNPSETAMFLTIKGGNNTNAPGFVVAFPVDTASRDIDGNRVVVSQPPQLRLNFGMTFISDERAIIADAAMGGALLTISPDFKVTVFKAIPVPNNAVSCWTAYAPAQKSAFIMDGGNGQIADVDPTTGEMRRVFVGTAAAGGAFDSTVGDGRYLYSLNTAPSITVFDLAVAQGMPPKMVQVFDLSSLGSRQGFQGLALY